MLSRLALSHARQVAKQKARAAVIRQNQRRSAGGGLPPLTGAADNAFNRERRAVKAHAAQSSGLESPDLWLIWILTHLLCRHLAQTVYIVKHREPYLPINPSGLHMAVFAFLLCYSHNSMPIISGMSIGSIGNTCLLWRSVPNTHIRILEQRISFGVMVTRLVFRTWLDPCCRPRADKYFYRLYCRWQISYSKAFVVHGMSRRWPQGTAYNVTVHSERLDNDRPKKNDKVLFGDVQWSRRPADNETRVLVGTQRWIIIGKTSDKKHWRCHGRDGSKTKLGYIWRSPPLPISFHMWIGCAHCALKKFSRL